MNRSTVFVIGAGASKEADLPTGDELKEKISDLLNMRFNDFGSRLESGDNVIVGSLRLHARQPDGQQGDINPFLHEAWHIVDAMPQAISIDNFMDTQSDNDKIALCGKLAIVRSILDAEGNSLLRFDRTRGDSTIDFSGLKNTWYIPFFQLLTGNCRKNDLEKRFKSTTLIIFNYDRCIEHYLSHALQNYYKISEPESAELINHIHIYHPYGDVGTLPWVMQNGAMPFGEKPSSEKLLELAKNIKTFTEGTDPGSSEIEEIQTKIGQATRLVFLGFAFHPSNMQLMTSSEFEYPQRKAIECYATTFRTSEANKRVIVEQIRGLYNKKIQTVTETADLQCHPFFDEYWKSLSF